MLEKGALEGVTVVDLSRLLPGPYCSMILADHGARVIALEDRRFLADGLFFSLVNRNKEHMSLNLKTEKGLEVFFRLVEEADVLIEGFRPGVTRRLGVDYPAVRRINPKIIYCSITGYGQTGAYRDRAGHDVNYLGYAGVLSLMGEADQPPCIPGIQIADMAGGGMNAAVGILLALYAREKTGKGQCIDISMTDGTLSLLPLARFFRNLNGRMPERGRWLLSHRYACYNTYETADGRYLAIGALENRFWRNLCHHLGMEELAPLQYDEDRRGEIIDRMRGVFRTQPLSRWESELADLDVCFASVRTMDEVYEDPFFEQRRMIVEVEDTAGMPHRTLGVPIRLSQTPGSVRTAPVDFGASTADILHRMGYTEAQIRDFQRQGVI